MISGWRRLFGWVALAVVLVGAGWAVSPVGGYFWEQRGEIVAWGYAAPVDEEGHWVTMTVVDTYQNNLAHALRGFDWFGRDPDPEAHARAVASAEAGVWAASVACGEGMRPYSPGRMQEGGSAGLLYGLASADRHYNGAVSQGRRIAVTGSVEPGGTVVEVGEIELKVRAAVDYGVDLIVVPTHNVAEAQHYAGGTPVLGVESVAEALAELAPGLCS